MFEVSTKNGNEMINFEIKSQIGLKPLKKKKNGSSMFFFFKSTFRIKWQRLRR